MHARISTWRSQGDDMDVLPREVVPVVAEIRRQPGYVAGYQVKTAPDMMTVVSIWQDEARMHEASSRIAELMRPFVEAGRLALVDVKNGPAEPWS